MRCDNVIDVEVRRTICGCVRLTCGLLGVETPSTCATNSLPNLRRAEGNSTTHNKSDNVYNTHTIQRRINTNIYDNSIPEIRLVEDGVEVDIRRGLGGGMQTVAAEER
jgi:hypothetical protein